jgi:hypothetical protein
MRTGPKLIWHRVHPLGEAGVDMRTVHKMPLFWIRGNVSKLEHEIHCVANSVLVETLLPDFPAKLLSHCVRKPTLNALGTPLDCLTERRGQQHVQVLRHYGEAMQTIAPLIAVSE